MMLLFLLILNLLSTSFGHGAKWFDRKNTHKLQEVDYSDVTKAVKLLGASDEFEKILDPILISRVPGTEGNAKVRQYITDFMKNLSWGVDLDTFEDKTPYGTKTFSNIVATLDPDAPRHLVLACHYDSKLNREYTFVAATDSAVPCAMMLSLAKDLDSLLKKPKQIATDLTLQFVFFDGEEAFVQWTRTDSIYGARHLAKMWEKTKYDFNRNDNTNELHRKDVLVLLDLLGSASPTIYSYFSETRHLHEALISIEKNLHDQKMLRQHRNNKAYFKSPLMRAGIEDDHIPFKQRGVAILHLIPVPFPDVWHKESDNKDNLDFNVIENLIKILGVFTIQYLHLPLNDNAS